MNRDKVALKAMTALIQSSPVYRENQDKLAEKAYKIADAMIKQSKL